MKLYYMDIEGNKDFITETQRDEEVYRSIEQYCMEHGFGLIYMIHHIEKNKIYYEFGKDGCFFLVEI